NKATMARKMRSRPYPTPVINSGKTGTNRIRPLLSPTFGSPALAQWRASRRTVMLGVLFAASGLGRRRAAAETGSHESRSHESGSHAIAMHGHPAWGPGFTHPTYANPEAPKGGQLTQGVLGTFDCLNPFIVKGLPAANMRGYVIESLLARGYDEPFTLYGLLAESVMTDAARTFVTFTINPAARFSDGSPVTTDDVIFSWELLRDKGRPNFRTYYAKSV